MNNNEIPILDRQVLFCGTLHIRASHHSSSWRDRLSFVRLPSSYVFVLALVCSHSSNLLHREEKIAENLTKLQTIDTLTEIPATVKPELKKM